ncbi:MAG: 5-amino-6-(D-ribitylamino)uracil--L-tyrosine 4-hydroxyphenyl transferase CofH [Halioglobus sp.]|nr:5-amino-6-(D-ribitylamino)uracil--L-tyrosine 4-hydroxyphenyl transferase CofH [Halioglobus sp.]
MAAAASSGITATTLDRPGTSLDVDEPADLLLAARRLAGRVRSETRELLAQPQLAARIAAAEHTQVQPFTAPAEVAVMDWPELRERLLAGHQPSAVEALSLATVADTAALAEVAGRLRDSVHGSLVTYSRKVFIPLTQLCRDVCHYCTFAKTPRRIEQPYMPVEEVLELCREGARLGCQEALFTLGEKPELRYSTARQALEDMGFASTLDYLREVASRVLKETGLLPHINAGCMTAQEIAALREVSASMGIMLESASERLCEKGMPHYGSPDKDPTRRLETLELAGRAAVPFTSGILIGIGETRLERIESLLALRAVHARHGHLQEVIVQNFRAKPDTQMARAPEPDLDELLWTIAVARLIFGAEMNIQAPPNLSPGVLPQIVAAGINDWGGVSPLTPDHVNPEAPWPHLDRLAAETAAAGKFLEQRLTIYPDYARAPHSWLEEAVRPAVAAQSDAAGFARRDTWATGCDNVPPDLDIALLDAAPVHVSAELEAIVARSESGETLTHEEVTRLFSARGPEFSYVVNRADRLRERVNGDTVSYIVNRNINYTNVCYFKCRFCAFSKGKHNAELRGAPYDISAEELAARCAEAWQRGATEVCLQGGIHPDYTGQTYLDIVATVRAATPGMHIHAFSPLEIWQGAHTLGLDLRSYLARLQAAGLNTLPGTAAEILHDDVRAQICPDKINTAQWLEVMAAAHAQGIRTTATIMYGHVEQPGHWAAHLLAIRQLQLETGGFTELVPLPFVAQEAPLYLRGRARPGPTFREAILMHAVARLVLHGAIDNIQASWVKMGPEGVAACLRAGVNDLGGSLMNESITRAAGASHGEEWSPEDIEACIAGASRLPRMRNTLYGNAPAAQRERAFGAAPVRPVQNAAAGKQQRSKRLDDVEDNVQRLHWIVEEPELSLYEQVVLQAACN